MSEISNSFKEYSKTTRKKNWKKTWRQWVVRIFAILANDKKGWPVGPILILYPPFTHDSSLLIWLIKLKPTRTHIKQVLKNFLLNIKEKLSSIILSVIRLRNSTKHNKSTITNNTNLLNCIFFSYCCINLSAIRWRQITLNVHVLTPTLECALNSHQRSINFSKSKAVRLDFKRYATRETFVCGQISRLFLKICAELKKFEMLL